MEVPQRRYVVVGASTIRNRSSNNRRKYIMIFLSMLQLFTSALIGIHGALAMQLPNMCVRRFEAGWNCLCAAIGIVGGFCAATNVSSVRENGLLALQIVFSIMGFLTMGRVMYIGMHDAFCMRFSISSCASSEFSLEITDIGLQSSEDQTEFPITYFVCPVTVSRVLLVAAVVLTAALYCKSVDSRQTSLSRHLKTLFCLVIAVLLTCHQYNHYQMRSGSCDSSGSESRYRTTTTTKTVGGGQPVRPAEIVRSATVLMMYNLSSKLGCRG